MNICRLKEIREDRDLTQNDIANILNTSQNQYSRYELGIRLIPIDKLKILALYYNVSIDYLICLTDIRKPYPKSRLNKSNTKTHIDRLKEMKLKNNLTQEAIAEVLKINQVQYSRYESGRRLIPIDKLVKLANYYNVSVDYLMFMTDDTSVYPKSILIN